METTKKTWSIFRVYLLLASIIGLIGGLISLGISLTSLAQRLVITTDEFVKGQRSYELQQCKEPYYYGKTETADAKRTPSKEQKESCEKEKTEQIILSRNVDSKMTILGGGIRAILFAILFFTHYPRFKKQDNQD